MKKTLKKGFTLIELIIVMAIFSVILLGAMRLVDPVSNIFGKASMNEKTYSNANNIQLYLQSKLQYSDFLWVKTGSYTEDDLKDIAETYRKNYYTGVVVSTNGVKGAEKLTDMDVYIMQLHNNPGVSLNGRAIPAGQITLRTYHSAAGAAITSAQNSENQLNPAYFQGKDNDYKYSYALGVSDFVNVDSSTRALAADYQDINIKDEMNYDNLAVSVVISDDFTDEANYRAFKNRSSNQPTAICAVNSATIPLMNIRQRGGVFPRRITKFGSDYIWQSDTIKYPPRLAAAMSPKPYIMDSFDFSDIYETPDFTKDIYFIFSYADSIK